MPLRRITRHLDIVLQQDTRKEHLDLVGGEEASRACMAAIAPEQAGLVAGDELVLGAGAGLGHAVAVGLGMAQLVVAEAVELFGVGVVRGVAVDSGGGNFDEGSCGNVGAVGEGEALEGFAGEGGWGTVSI